MVLISKEVHFCAAHKLYNPSWSKQKNEEIFGLCANENWHGHNFNLIVTISGEPDPDTGFVMNFKDLKQLVEELVIEQVDHKNLNLDVPFMEGKLTTCENLVKAFWEILEPQISVSTAGRATLYCLKLFETPTSYAEYYGEKIK
ncbi:MAG TPA: 6-carboxytetrahydropterin synthase [Cyclobacteriaceae bacterium]|nr:6-carboxytetrahydropterin synthase [Cyclobacteriaceae bacterium]